jgi:hypothetical protein
MNAFGKFLMVFLTGILAFTLTSCGGSSGGESTGTLSLSLSDAPASDYSAVYVTVAEIQVHRTGEGEGRWETILTPNTTLNLLTLTNGRTASLGVAELPVGSYTQMRLILGDTPDSTTNILGHTHDYPNYFIDSGANIVPLVVPSGYQTGIKIIRNFEVQAGQRVGLILDFDAGRSIVQAGSSGKWLLKPTIKIIDTVNVYALSGIVTDGSDEPIPGAMVTAQTYNASTGVTIFQGTITSSELGHEGEYLMYLPYGTYNIVITKDEYNTASETILLDEDTPDVDFSLTSATMEYIGLALALPPNSPDKIIDVQFLLGTIAVKELYYHEEGTYTVRLPKLPMDVSYSIVASYDDHEDITINNVTTYQIDQIVPVSIDFN